MARGYKGKYPLMPTYQARVFHLHEKEGLSHEEIGQKLGIQRRSSYYALKHAKRTINDLLVTLCDVYDD